MLLQYYDKETDLANMKFNRVAFWVQVHDIPLRFRTQKVAEWICETIVSFKYKRLLNMCYWCGCLTHDDRDYEMWIESEGSLLVDSRRFGS